MPGAMATTIPAQVRIHLRQIKDRAAVLALMARVLLYLKKMDSDP
jgi:hypothetical protein